ncbi:MAG: peptidylprolyl isomerase [Haloferacaceae archaeon]
MSDDEQVDETETGEAAGDDAPAETEETTDAEAEAAAEESETATAGIQDGDFVRLEYTVRTVDDGRVVDTTIEEVAEEAGIDEEDYEFSPRTIVVGSGHVFASVDEALVGAEVGDEDTVTVPASEAFGEFDPDQVRTVSADKIDEDDRYPGAQVQIDGDQGHLETIVGGRARVDFNHPLAGEELEYEYEVVEVVEDRAEKAQGLLGIYLQDVPEVRIETDEVEEEVEVEVEVEPDDEDEEPTYETETQVTEKETLYIEATPGMAMNQQWLFQKQQIAQQLMDQLDLDRVIVEEVIEGPGGMMGGMGGMMGGMGGGAPEDVEEALEDVDVDADEIVEEIEGAAEEADADVETDE